MNSSTRCAELKSHSRPWWAASVKTGRQCRGQSLLPHRKLIPQKTYRTVTIMKVARTLINDHTFRGWASGTYNQIVFAEIKHSGRHMIERHQMLIEASSLWDPAKKGCMYVSVAQGWGQRVAIENECKKVRRRTDLGNRRDDALSAPVPYKPGMDDRSTHRVTPY